MITYDRLWQTMKERGVTQYDLYTHYNFNRSLINRLKHNRNVEVGTLDRLCRILHCRLEDIAEYREDKRIGRADAVRQKSPKDTVSFRTSGASRSELK